jgi:hypothetical protein
MIIDTDSTDSSDPALKVQNPNGSLLDVRSNGKVGIGTASPAEKLTIDGTVSGAYVRISNAASGDISSGYTIYNGNNLDYAVYTNPTFGNTTLLTREALAIRAGGSQRMIILSGGNVGIGTTSPDTLLHVYNPDANWGAYSVITLGTDVEGTNQAQLKYYRGASTATESFQLSVRGTTALTALYNGNVGIGTTSPTSRLDVKGCVAMGAAIYDGNPSTSTTGFSQQNGGSLHINWGLGGAGSSGDTITFTYAATSWKSWSLKYNFASTSGITEGVVGGYWNNSGSSGNYIAYNQHGVSVAVTHTGQGNTVTFTFTNLGTHPMANFVYMQSGGDGQPRMDRVVLNAVT